MNFETFVRFFLPRKMPNFSFYIKKIAGKSGFEIGGPSKIFENYGLAPVYKYVKNLDNCNFKSETIWGGKIAEGRNYKFNKLKNAGYQYIFEATNLKGIKSKTYDFVLASHVLEHIANPIKALKEWKRIIKPGGYILVIVPDKAGTFDHRRSVTELKHLVSDYKSNMSEGDLSHLEEIIKLHDLDKDLQAGRVKDFRKRSLDNYHNRCLHHHVYDISLLKNIIEISGFKVVRCEMFNPYHILVFAQKLG